MTADKIDYDEMFRPDPDAVRSFPASSNWPLAVQEEAGREGFPTVEDYLRWLELNQLRELVLRGRQVGHSGRQVADGFGEKDQSEATGSRVAADSAVVGEQHSLRGLRLADRCVRGVQRLLVHLLAPLLGREGSVGASSAFGSASSAEDVTP